MTSYHQHQNRYCTTSQPPDPDMICRYCQSPSLFTDYAQGDVVCTSCGTVAQSHIVDDSPEWADYNNPDDLAKSLPSMARSGMTRVDDTKYIGGLESTTLSRAFEDRHNGNGERRAKESKIRQHLVRNDVVVNAMMKKTFEKQLKKKTIARKVKKGGYSEKADANDHDSLDLGTVRSTVRSTVRNPVREQKRDADYLKAHLTLNSEKYSLDRALLLHGTSDEINTRHVSFDPHSGEQSHDVATEKEELWKSLDISQRTASLDVYKATRMVVGACQKLELTETKVLGEATNMLCKYASLNWGFNVKGVTTHLSHSFGSSSKDHSKNRKALELNRVWNKARQMGSIGAAFLFFACKKYSQGRSVPDICSSFNLFENAEFMAIAKNGILVKPRHYFKAMKEIKALLPEYVSSATTVSIPSETTSNATLPSSMSQIQIQQEESTTIRLVEHTIRNLQLPSAAIVAITQLVLHQKRQQFLYGIGSGIKPSTMIASTTYFVCVAGAVMQRLSKQALESFKMKMIDSSQRNDETRRRSKKRRFETELPNHEAVKIEECYENSIPDAQPSSTVLEPFDVFSEAAIKDDVVQNNRKRQWYEWSREKQWHRELLQIENSCKVSQSIVCNHYRKHLLSQRCSLLKILEESIGKGNVNRDVIIMGSKKGVLSNLEMLMGNITLAAALLKK